MERERLCVVHNPRAGDASPPARSLLAMLSKAGYQTRYRTSKEALEEALQEPVDLVVVVGGDGTVGPVAQMLGGRSLSFTILPVGTANNIAKSFGIAGDAREVVAAWATMRPRPFDTWAVSVGEASAVFVESMGAGPMVPPIASNSPDPPTFILGGAIDRARYAVASAVAAAPVRRWHIEADGRDISGDYIGLEAMNTRSVGPNLPLAEDADPGDGSIDLVLMRASDREPLREHLLKASMARSTVPLELPTYRCSQVRLLPPRESTLHVDSMVWRPDAFRDGGEIHLRPAAQCSILAPAGPWGW